jgi:ParB/RepB/Spo0J family partition protein
VAGHRRLTAIRKLGLKNKVPCLIKQFESADGVGAALSENLNREGLHCIDVANGYHHLITHNWSIEQVAQHFERDKKTVARFLKLAELPNDIKEALRENSNVFSARVIFNDLLTKHKLPNEIRKAIERKLSKKRPENKNKKQNLNDRLNDFFKQNKITKSERDLVLNAFKFVGLLK